MTVDDRFNGGTPDLVAHALFLIEQSPQTIACKCCGSVAKQQCSIDFNRHCKRDQAPDMLPPAGIPVPFYRCSNCHFLFTPAFDRFSLKDFSKYIYNESYELIDESYDGARGRRQAEAIYNSFKSSPNIAILDYGCGKGTLASNLSELGFKDVTSYDPFVPEFAVRPNRKFDFVTAFEVAEHSCSPKEFFADLVGFLNPQGLVLFATLLQPDLPEEKLKDWWYLAPRNGHVSLYSAKSLQILAEALGMRITSMGDGVHWLHSQIPAFACHIL